VFISDLIGFTTGLLITVLLLALTLRAINLPGTPLANIGFAAGALLWSVGGLAWVALIAGGEGRQSPLTLGAQAIQYVGAAVFPIPVMAIWRPFAVLGWQKSGARIVWACGWLAAAALAALWVCSVALDPAPLAPAALKNLTAYNASLILSLGAVICLRRKSSPRAVYLPSLMIVGAAWGASIALAIARNPPPNWRSGGVIWGVGVHLVLLVVLFSFLLFARFRYADVFIRYGVRILLAGTWAAALTAAAQSNFLFHLARQGRSPAAVHVFLVFLVANGLLLSFTFVDERFSGWVNRWLFRAPDYRAWTRRLADRLRGLSFESEIAAAVEEAARTPLELSGARLVSVTDLATGQWPAAVLEGEPAELAFGDRLRKLLPLANTELLIPVAVSERITRVLLVAPGSDRPGLVSHDLSYLTAVAAQCGQRLDALGREREAVERQSREALLLQQVTEAELRALRAQINPHFLFNSLNTIADLIVRDPAGAETMTLRLAGVFRHALAHSRRPLTPVRDEIEFVRTYLHIEEARFGDRLQVEIEVSPEVAGEERPSLILQPLVENALKHGLGPKPGPGRLWISAQPEGAKVRLRVEDDGLGPGGRPAGAGWELESAGVGLSNIAERLVTLYQDGASVRLEPREGGGSRATVLLPRVGKAA
jgi:two-component system LytT family sensor kinase